jgi:hypothetical protein
VEARSDHVSVFDSLQLAGFDGLIFPIRSCRVKAVMRHHTHEYLKTPGGLNEKLERGLYKIEMDAVFDVNIEGYGANGAPLWPTVLATLRTKFEKGTTGPLVIPTIGTIPAFLTDWDQEMKANHRSGETVPLSFLEDQSETFLTEALIDTDVTSLAKSAVQLETLSQEMDPRPNIFDDINAAANSILAIKDQADLFGARVESQILQLANLIRQADDFIQNPVDYKIVDALHELADAAISLARSFGEQAGEPRVYVVPVQMSMSQISTAIYGDTSHAVELMQNNTVDDVFAVPAGTPIIYFTTGKIAA